MKPKFSSTQRLFLTMLFILAAILVIAPLNFANAAMNAKKGSAMHPMRNACQKKANTNMAMHVKMKAMKRNMMMKSNNMKSMKGKLIAAGKKLFYSKSIGTNGFSCATCHVYSAGTYMKAHGRGMVIMPIKNAAKKVETFNKTHHTRLTLKQKIMMCDRMALKGHMSMGEIDALTAYVNSLK